MVCGCGEPGARSRLSLGSAEAQESGLFGGGVSRRNDIYQSQELQRAQIFVLKGLLQKPRDGYCWIRESRVCVPPPDTCPADGRSESRLGLLV